MTSAKVSVLKSGMTYILLIVQGIQWYMLYGNIWQSVCYWLCL